MSGLIYRNWAERYPRGEGRGKKGLGGGEKMNYVEPVDKRRSYRMKQEYITHRIGVWPLKGGFLTKKWKAFQKSFEKGVQLPRREQQQAEKKESAIINDKTVGPCTSTYMGK